MYNTKPPSPSLSQAEHQFLFAHGLRIVEHWVSPDEGIEYGLIHLGGDITQTIIIKKSERAAFNAAIRYLRI